MEHPIFSTPNILYWAYVLIATYVSARYLGRLWKRRENMRWAAGYVIVFVPGIIPVALGYWDPATWLGLFFAVGLASINKVANEAYRDANEAAAIRQGGENERPAVR